MRFLTLITDAYGGRGGIAKFNRDLCRVRVPLAAQVTTLLRMSPVTSGEPHVKLFFSEKDIEETIIFSFSTGMPKKSAMMPRLVKFVLQIHLHIAKSIHQKS